MSFLRRLERSLGWLAVPNVTLALIIGQVLVYGLAAVGSLDLRLLVLSHEGLLAGEIWRAVTFIFMPPIGMHPIFMAFVWYLFFLMGSALEREWGVFRYNLFLWVGFLATVAAVLLTSGAIGTNVFMAGSVFLAFAFLNPHFELLLLFILPVQIKWFALLTWLGYGWVLLTGSWSDRVMVIAATANFVLFFGKDIVGLLRARQRRASYQAKQEVSADEPFHRCHACGITDLSHPEMQFRYCSSCEGDYAYCEEHLRNHEHVVRVSKEEKTGENR